MSNEPSENWDDDFPFTANDLQRHGEPSTSAHNDFLTPSHGTNNLMPHDYAGDTAHSRYSFTSSAWDIDDTTVADSSSPKRRLGNEHDVTRPTPNLAKWSEETPSDDPTADDVDFLSAPTRDSERTAASRRRLKLSTGSVLDADADFHKEPAAGPSKQSWTNETNYDQDFEEFPTIGAQPEASSAVRPPSVASTRSSLRQGRVHQHVHTRSSSSLHLPSASGPALRNAMTGSPVPPSMGSPTLSSFSALVSLSSERSRSSMYPLIPPGTSSPRVRRRLRKKSRPQEFDGTIMEMMPPRSFPLHQPRASGSSEGLGLGYRDDYDIFDEQDEDRLSNGDPTIIGGRAASPATYHDYRPSSPYDVRADGAMSPTNITFAPIPSPPASPPRKIPLLSRIGSMKRWRSRRSSTPSQDVSLDMSMESVGMSGSTSYIPPETPEPGLMRAVSPTAPAPSSNRTSWLFSRVSASPASHGNGTSQPSPELKRSSSHSRPQSRFGQKRSTTVGDVLEERGEDPGRVVLGNGDGETKASFDEEPVLGSLRHPNTSTPPISGMKPKSRRPLSLQPHKRPSGPASNAGSWIGSVGRSTSNPFVASGLWSKSKENIASDVLAVEERDRTSGVLKKRISTSASRRSPHKRSISLTSDPDDIILISRHSPTPLGILQQGPPPPPVPPLPSQHQSHVIPPSRPLLPPIALSPPSPPDTTGRGSGAATSPLLRASSADHPASSPRIHQLQGQHSLSMSNSSSSSPTTGSPRGVTLLSVTPSSSGSGQSLSLGRGSQMLASQFLAVTDSGPLSASPSSNSGPSASPSVLSVNTSGSSSTLRRSSLGDLKIPARISMAQTGLRNNLGMLREFATKVDDIQKLQSVRTAILSEILGNRVHSAGSSSSVLLNSSTFARGLKAKPSLERLEQQYALWWECAELLVELGGTGASGSSSMKGTPPPPKEKPLSPAMVSASIDDDPTVTLKGREDDSITVLSATIPLRPRERQRSITLIGHEKTPPDVTKALSTQHLGSTAPSPTSSSTDSRGRNDLSMRQLTLLKEMLETPDPTVFDRHHSSGIRFASQPESQQRVVANGYGHPTASAITLPSIPSSPRRLPATGSSSSVSEDSSNIHFTPGHHERAAGIGKGTAGKGKRLQRLRDILRSLTKTSPSTRDRDRPNLLSTSELNVSRRYQQSQANGRDDDDEKKQRRRKSTDPAIVTASQVRQPARPSGPLKRANSPYGITSLDDRGHRSSPRRPSLASIFRIGQSHAASAGTSITPLGSNLRGKGLRQKPPTSAKDSRTSITDDDEDNYSDWDRMDSASDLEGGMSPTPRRAQSPRHHEQSTIKGRHTRTPTTDQQQPSPVPPLHSVTPTPKLAPRENSSQISLRSSPSKPRLGGRFRSHTTDASVPPPPSAGLTQPSMSNSGVNSPASTSAMPTPNPADFKLALTPENIRPLLEYAKEVSARLNDCISELRDVQARSGPIAIEAGA